MGKSRSKRLVDHFKSQSCIRSLGAGSRVALVICPDDLTSVGLFNVNGQWHWQLVPLCLNFGLL